MNTEEHAASGCCGRRTKAAVHRFPENRNVGPADPTGVLGAPITEPMIGVFAQVDLAAAAFHLHRLFEPGDHFGLPVLLLGGTPG